MKNIEAKIETWDNLLTEKEREDIKNSEEKIREERCEFLKKKGECFYYCSKYVKESAEADKPSRKSSIYFHRIEDAIHLIANCFYGFRDCYIRKR